jgi:hypothetical protein
MPDMDESLPAWATVLIAVGSALVSGALGAVVANWWQTRHERREEWRSRLIEAADTFASHAVEAYRAADTAVDSPKSIQALQRLLEEYDQARTAAYRVDLLFGIDSDTRSEAWNFVDAIDDVSISLRRNPQEIADAKKRRTDAYLARYRFGKAAHDAVRELKLP